MKTTKIISYFTYTITMSIFCNFLFNLNFTQLDLKYLSHEILYLYFFGIHAFSIIIFYGYYENFISTYSSYWIMRYQNIKYIFYYFTRSCLVYAGICSVIKAIVEYIVFSYFELYVHILYFLLFFLILFIQMQLEIFIHKNISLLVIFMHLAVSLTIGDILYEYQFYSFIPLFIPNLMMASRNTSIFSTIIIVCFIHIVLYIFGYNFIKRKDIL